MRALIVTNMYPSPQHPALGSFVRDQVEALRAGGEVELELLAFSAGGSGARAYVNAARTLRRRYGATRFDVVHAHFGLTAWPAHAVAADVHAVTLHGTDVVHPRSRAITLAALPLQDLVATVSQPLAQRLPPWALRDRPPAVLPCGVATGRFAPIERARARRELGLRPDAPYLLFPSDPARPEKRFDRVHDLLGALPLTSGPQLLTLGAIDPTRVPLFVNAADAVVVTSERESFGLATLEALACDVPVLSTPVGEAPTALHGIEGTLCAPFDPARWAQALAPHLLAPGTEHRIAGRERALEYGADAMAVRVIDAWRDALSRRR